MLKRLLKTLTSLIILLIVAGFLYIQSVWNPAVPKELVARVHQISADHGGYVPLSKMPIFLQQALIATEDQNFYHNMGIDFEGIARAVVVDIQAGSLVQGASTITEQLVKDIFLTSQKTISRKLKQIAMAVMLTHSLSKNEILALYLNEVYLGNDAYGVGDASEVYFHKPVWSLSPAQCAMLAGLPQAPSRYDPFLHLQLAKARQLEVLQRMVSTGFITERAAKTIASEPLGLK